MKDESAFKKKVVLVCCVIAACHIVACLYFTLLPKAPLAKTRIGNFYIVRIMTGPFFTSNRLRMSPQLLMSYKTKEGIWSLPYDVGKAKLQLYQHAPWKFNALAKAAFIRHCGRNIHKVQQDSVQFENEFVTFHSFLVRDVLPAEKPDSVGLTYVRSYYYPDDDKLKSDTAWSIFYNLEDKRVR